MTSKHWQRLFLVTFLLCTSTIVWAKPEKVDPCEVAFSDTTQQYLSFIGQVSPNAPSWRTSDVLLIQHLVGLRQENANRVPLLRSLLHTPDFILLRSAAQDFEALYQLYLLDQNNSIDALSDELMGIKANFMAAKMSVNRAVMQKRMEQSSFNQDVAFVEVQADRAASLKEAAFSVSDMLRGYSRAAEDLGLKAVILEHDDPPPLSRDASTSRFVLRLEGPLAYYLFKTEEGLHNFYRFARANGGRQANSKSSHSLRVHVFHESRSDVALDLGALKKYGSIEFKAITGSGPGGQSVNTTYSAVQGIFRPFDGGLALVVKNQTERSQHQNLQTAQRLLVAKAWKYVTEKLQQKAEEGPEQLLQLSRDPNFVRRRYNLVDGSIHDPRADGFSVRNFPEDRFLTQSIQGAWTEKSQELAEFILIQELVRSQETSGK